MNDNRAFATPGDDPALRDTLPMATALVPADRSPIARPVEVATRPPVIPVDDGVVKDGGKATENERIPTAEYEKIVVNAVEHTREEPGS